MDYQTSIALLFFIGYLYQAVALPIRTKSRKENYQKYIKSNRWRKKRLRRLRIDKWRCQRCDADLKKTQAHVHHKTYKRLGRERMKDLESLCAPCHTKEHRK